RASGCFFCQTWVSFLRPEYLQLPHTSLASGLAKQLTAKCSLTYKEEASSAHLVFPEHLQQFRLWFIFQPRRPMHATASSFHWCNSWFLRSPAQAKIRSD